MPRSLGITFATPEDLESEYGTNIANGGIFLASEESFSLRERVCVEIDLPFCSERLQLRGEVVHRIPPELASSGATPGVAIQFDELPDQIRSFFEPILGEARANPKPSDHDDRRSAPRSRARVRARVHCPGVDVVEGRTRDLSIGGVLVSVSGVDPIGIGEPVQVFVTNPATGEEREILGRIVRHVVGEGEMVRAIAVQFHVSDEDRPEVERFLSELAAGEHSRHLGGIQGAIESLGLINLVQTFGIAAPEGTLDVLRGAEEGYITFENGCLRAAAVAGTTGVKALARMLAWPDGSFEFHARIDRGLPANDPIPLDAALIEAMRLMDASSDVDRAAFPPRAGLRVDPDARAALEDPTKLEQAVLDLAAAGMRVQRVLDVIPETDDEIYLALWTLADQGVILVGD